MTVFLFTSTCVVLHSQFFFFFYFTFHLKKVLTFALSAVLPLKRRAQPSSKSMGKLPVSFQVYIPSTRICTNWYLLAGRIAELERALAREKRLNEALEREQAENVKLISEYETGVGAMVDQIRNYCQNNNMHYLSQKRHYNNLLQVERDAHLQSRLERDEWEAKALRCADMIRTAYRLRCEEEEVPIRIVQGLQNEVRAYRNALGMEPEKPEEEYGWEVLKNAPGGPDLGLD